MGRFKTFIEARGKNAPVRKNGFVFDNFDTAYEYDGRVGFDLTVPSGTETKGYVEYTELTGSGFSLDNKLLQKQLDEDDKFNEALEAVIDRFNLWEVTGED